MVINETIQATLEATKSQIYSPVVILVWVSILLLFPFITWIHSLNRKIKWDNFLKIWLWTVVASAFVVSIFVFSPASVFTIFNWVKEFVGI